jgi:membrane-associated protease RseP (regulator of RpoE activity)
MLLHDAPDIDLPLVTWVDYIAYIPHFYVRTVGELIVYASTHPRLLAEGASFAGALLAILTAHESGHYIACRYYGVDATLPFFIPAPPLLLFGTFGAFIKIKSPIPSRRALFDIGLAGPLAGFIVLVPIAIIGILTLRPAPPLTGSVTVMVFNDPLLFRLIGRAFKVGLDGKLGSPFYLAAWFGVLVTSLNLIPVGQLDGGHATYALFGGTMHGYLGRAAFVIVAALAILGWFWHSSPSGFLYTVLLAVMLKVRHPQPDETEALGATRIAIAFVTLLVFALCFWPFPITIT